MILRTYGILDSVAKEYVRTFTAKNDEEAERACRYVVRDKTFDNVAGKDYSVSYLYSVDTESGRVLDNTITPICNMATFIEEYKHELLEKTLMENLLNQEFIESIKLQILAAVAKENIKDERKCDKSVCL